MDKPNLIVDFLREPNVKDCLLQLLASPLPAEERYQKFLDFCASRSLAAPGISAGDQTALLAPRLVQSICRAAWRMQRSQHLDGGWGPNVEQSAFWHTAYAVLFLWSVRAMPVLQELPDIEGMLHRGVAYLEQHPEKWSTDTLSTVDGMPVYEIALMIRCFYHVGRSFLRRESALRIYRSMDRLYHSQNADGGWDVNIWGYEVSTPIRVWSEVGATGAAVQALADTHDERFRLTVEKGVNWLVQTQNENGSWNDGSVSPELPRFQLSGAPSISKTCDALQGLLSAEAVEISLKPYRACIDRAADWLHRQELPVLDRQNHLTGWGWGYSSADYEHTCLTLETLLRLPVEPLAALSASAAWLVEGQRRQKDDSDDGGWPLGHTARIGLSLAAFYQRLVMGETFYTPVIGRT